MASTRIKMRLIEYGKILTILTNIPDENESMFLCSEFSKNASVINETNASDDEIMVLVKLELDIFAKIMAYCFDNRMYDVDYYNYYTAELMNRFVSDLEDRKKMQEEKEVYERWLIECFDKYVTDKDMPCRNVAAAINEGEKPKEPLKYQNIMRQLKAYKEEKFGI